MKDNSIYNEQIDRFLKGKMSTEEEQQFKKEIGQNPELKQQVREHLYLIRGIKQVKTQEEQDLLNRIKQEEQDSSNVGNHIPTAASLRKKFNWIRISGIAAAVAVVLVLSGTLGSNLYYRHEAHQYAYNASVEIMADFAVPSRGTADEELKDRLTVLFDNARDGKDLPATIEELTRIYDLTKDDYVDTEDDYAYQIGWFLVVAYINNKEYNKATKIIEGLSNDYPDNEHIALIKRTLQKYRTPL